MIFLFHEVCCYQLVVVVVIVIIIVVAAATITNSTMYLVLSTKQHSQHCKE